MTWGKCDVNCGGVTKWEPDMCCSQWWAISDHFFTQVDNVCWQLCTAATISIVGSFDACWFSGVESAGYGSQAADLCPYTIVHQLSDNISMNLAEVDFIVMRTGDFRSFGTLEAWKPIYDIRSLVWPLDTIKRIPGNEVSGSVWVYFALTTRSDTPSFTQSIDKQVVAVSDVCCISTVG
jgi:hypothetical protein